MSELSAEKVQQAVDAILKALGEPQTPLHKEALMAFQQGNYARNKRLASTHLSDSFCRSLGYLGSALKLTPNTDTILAEAARAAADHAKDRTMGELSLAIASALEPGVMGV